MVRRAKEPYIQKAVSIYESDTDNYRILKAMTGAKTEADFIRVCLHYVKKAIKENPNEVKAIAKGEV
jgi:hypothetical protein